MVKRYKSVIFILLTVMIALATSLLTYKWLKERSSTNPQAGTVNIAVAVADLGWGTVIKPEMVKMVPFLKASLVSGFFTDPGLIQGRVVITPIKADEPVFESRLAPSDIKRGGVAAVISENRRAMAVKVDRVKGVSGFIHPGNRVDVVATFRPSYASMPVTLTIIENVPVLATGTETQIKGKEEKPQEVDVITLEVSPEEAEVLALASAEGKLQLSLRNFTDTKNLAPRGASVQSLLRILSGKSADPGKKGKGKKDVTPVKENYQSVQLIEGHKVNEVKFKERSE